MDEPPKSQFTALDDGKNAAKSTTRKKTANADSQPQKHIIFELIDYMRFRSWKKKLLTVIVFCTSALVIVDMIFFGYINSWLEGFFKWMFRHAIAGLFAFLGLFVVGTLIFIPPALMTLAAGYIYAQIYGWGPGVLAASMICFLGSSVGAVLAYIRAQYMARDLIKLFARRYPIIRAADKALRRNGFKVMLLLRLCPLIPFNALNYIGGVTSVNGEDFTSSLIGIIPMQLLTVCIGATASNAFEHRENDDHKLVRVVLISTGIAFAIIAVIMTWSYARKELQKEVDAAAEAEEELTDPEKDTNGEPEPKYEEGKDDEEWFWIWS